MGQEFGAHVKVFVPSLFDRAAQMDGIPVDDDCGEQVEAGDTAMLPAIKGWATDAALSFRYKCGARRSGRFCNCFAPFCGIGRAP